MVVKKKLDLIKAELLERKVELEHEIAELNIADMGEQGLDVGDQAQSISRETLRVSLQNTEAQEYNNILKALQMIEDGDYGVCVDCENKIAEKRLDIFPNATRCLMCQEKFESD